MKTVFISAEEQLHTMEEIHCNSGATVLEAIRDEMALSVRLTYGKTVDIEYEAISKQDLADFSKFMEQSED